MKAERLVQTLERVVASVHCHPPLLAAPCADGNKGDSASGAEVTGERGNRECEQARKGVSDCRVCVTGLGAAPCVCAEGKGCQFGGLGQVLPGLSLVSGGGR